MKSEQEIIIRRTIRDALAIDPLISERKLLETLDARGIKLGRDRNYLRRMRDKALKEAAKESSITALESRMAEVRDRARLIKQELIRIGFGEKSTDPSVLPPLPRDRVNALKAIVDIDLRLMKSEITVGLYRKATGALDDDARNIPIGSEAASEILEAMMAWGIGPDQVAAAIAKRVPSRVVEHAPVAEQQPEQKHEPVALLPAPRTA